MQKKIKELLRAIPVNWGMEAILFDEILTCFKQERSLQLYVNLLYLVDRCKTECFMFYILKI